MKFKILANYTIFLTLLLVVTIGVLEIASPLLLYLSNGKWISRAEIQETLSTDKAKKSSLEYTNKSPKWMNVEVLHPYFGFVRNYAIKDNKFNGIPVKEPINDLGFFGPLPPQGRNDNIVSVMLTGGSVAAELFLYAKDTLHEQLKNIPEYAGKEIEITSFSLGGFKQPQQLIVLNYLLSLDYDVDVVINFDGFNEIVLPFAENIPFQVSPFYPRHWRLYSAKALPSDALFLMSKITSNNEMYEKWKAIASKPLLFYSNTSLALWHSLSKKITSQRLMIEKEFQDIISETKKLSAQEQGPPYTYQKEEDIFAATAKLWQKSSEQMWLLCRANNIKYYHFLQPSQYIKGSKKLTSQELKKAYGGPDYSYRKGVEAGYPFLKEAGYQLKLRGVPFFDLTNIFNHEERTIYRDKCCHVTTEGSKLLATEITTTIKNNFKL